MHKCFRDNSIRGVARPKRRAFSLAEMVVAMGILVLMLALVGQVFSLTVKSTGQATALVHLNQALRAFEETVRADLRGVYPGRSVMVIQGNTVDAFWTAEDAEAGGGGLPSAGYPHPADPERDAATAAGTAVVDATGVAIRTLPRADILMMFTNRKGRSFRDPEIQSNLQQVVYGHAESGEYVVDPNAGAATPFVFENAIVGAGMFPSDASGTPAAPFPAQQWHLARRSIQLISSQAPDLTASGKALDWVTDLFQNARGPFLGDPRLLEGVIDVVVNFDYESLVNYDTMDPGNTTIKDPSIQNWHLPWVMGRRGDHAAQSPFQRSMLDMTPPPLYADRLGHYMLPNCASFKVEWSLNPRSDFVSGRLSGIREILWIDPGQTADPVGRPDPALDDPLHTLQAKMDALPPSPPPNPPGPKEKLALLLHEPKIHADGSRYSLVNRFRSDQTSLPTTNTISDPWMPLSTVFHDSSDHRANTHVFTATRRVSDLYGALVEPPDYVPDDVFPTALRITVDVYDPQQRLDRPMRHVIIATVGG